MGEHDPPVALAPRWSEPVEVWVVSITILGLQRCAETLGSLLCSVEIHGVTDRPPHILWELIGDSFFL